MRVAALFVDRRGPYWNREDVDAWDLERDARNYAGPWPVVAHPPCQLWVNLAQVNLRRWGGAHNRPGLDGGAFKWALFCVRTYGGVLEHPADSKAWWAYGLLPPIKLGCWNHDDVLGGWTCEVWQSAYGHAARKRTWLYYCGQIAPPDLNWSQEPGTHQVGWFDRNKPTLSKAEAIKSPPAFAELLIGLARNARAQERAA